MPKQSAWEAVSTAALTAAAHRTTSDAGDMEPADAASQGVRRSVDPRNRHLGL